MRRLVRISLNRLLLDLIPIVMWVVLGKIIDKNIANLYIITYSFQFIVSLLVSVFGTGPNITAEKKQNWKIIDSNIILGTCAALLVAVGFSLKVDSYLIYMNLDPDIYREFCVYSFIVMAFEATIRIICEKLYFRNENKKANRITMMFSIINVVTIILTAFIIRSNKTLIIAVTIVIDIIVLLYIFITNIDKISFNFELKDNIKYVSNDIFDAIGMFIIYFIGQKMTFEFGTMYLIAMNFETMISDTQWDMSYSIITAATIDASKDKLNYKESLKNSRKLVAMLILSILLMGGALYPFFKPSLSVVAIFVGVQIINLILFPKICIRQQYLQINYSAKKNTFHKNIYEIIRIIFSFVPTPFCTYIGQFLALLYEVIIYDIYYRSKFYIENGYLKIKKEKA